MYIDFMLDVFSKNGGQTAIIWHDTETKYDELLILYQNQLAWLKDKNVEGKVVSLEADFSPLSVVTLLGLIELGCIVVL